MCRRNATSGVVHERGNCCPAPFGIKKKLICFFFLRLCKFPQNRLRGTSRKVSTPKSPTRVGHYSCVFLVFRVLGSPSILTWALSARALRRRVSTSENEPRRRIPAVFWAKIWQKNDPGKKQRRIASKKKNEIFVSAEIACGGRFAKCLRQKCSRFFVFFVTKKRCDFRAFVRLSRRGTFLRRHFRG